MPVIGRITGTIERLYQRAYERTGGSGPDPLAMARQHMAVAMVFPNLTHSIGAKVKS